MQTKRFLSLLLTVAMLITVCASVLTTVVLAINEATATVNVARPLSSTAQTNVIMNVGSDESERNFVWYCNSGSGSLDLAVRDGDTFPSEYETYNSSTVYSESSSAYVHRVSVFDLEPETEYVYRLRNDNVVSGNYYFETAPVDHFNFAFAGDPQIGAYGTSYIAGDGTKWGNAVNLIKTKFPHTTLFITAGDQVNNGNNEAQYDAFLAPTNLPTFAFATTIGNHETSYYNMSPYTGGPAIYQEHFNLPNTITGGTKYNTTETASNYWYTYNNVLFLHLNANSLSYAEHQAFMEAAIAANPNVTWKVVVMHYGLYGAWYYDKEAIILRRDGLAPIFDELDIDVVLNGHEHVYARSYMIEGGAAGNYTATTASSVTDPKGILYITASSSSGSKYYELLDDAAIPHVAVKYKYHQTISNVEVDKDSFKITTYNVANGNVLDTFEIVKTNTTQMPASTNIALGKTYEKSDLYVKDGVVKYPDETGKTMTDGAVAPDDAIYSDAAFMGFHKATSAGAEKGSVTVDLGKSYNLGRFVARVGTKKCTSGVTAPTKVEVYVSNDKSSWTLAGSTNVVDNDRISCMAVNVFAENKVTGRYVQYRFFNENGVFAMVAEVEAYEWHDHTLSDWEVFSEPSLYTDGVKVKHCITCGKSAERELTPAYATDPNNKNRALGRKYTTTAPNRGDGNKYNDDCIRLTDGEKGNPDGGGTGSKGSKAYSGWNTNVDACSVEIKFDLDTPMYTDTYTIYIAGGNWGIEIPTELISLDVYVSNDLDAGYTLVATAPVGSAVLTNGDGVSTNAWSTYTVTATAKYAKLARYVKLVINNAYNGGDSIWLDEVEVCQLNDVVAEPAHTHIGGDWVTVTKPTTSKAGVKEKRCASCGVIIETAEIAPLSPDEANLASGKSYTTSGLYTAGGTEAKYPDTNNAELTDGILPPSDALYSNAAYIGFNTGENYTNKYFAVTVDLGQEYELGKFIAYVASSYNRPAGITAPSSVGVYVSSDNSTFTLAGNGITVDDSSVSCIGITVELDEAVNGRYVQFRFIASSNWVMVAEVEAYKFNSNKKPVSTSPLLEIKSYTAPEDNKYYPNWAPWNEEPGFSYDDGIRLIDGKKEILGWTDAISAWYYRTGGDVEFVLELESTSTVDKIMGHFIKYGGNGIPTSFKVAYSVDGVVYTTVENAGVYFEPVAIGALNANMGTFNYTVVLDTPVKANYIKVMLSVGDNSMLLCEELEVYGYSDDAIVSNGDVNDDGHVDSVDYLLLKRSCFNTYTLSLEEKTRGDVDKSGIIDSVDYVLVKRIVFGTYSIQ